MLAILQLDSKYRYGINKKGCKKDPMCKYVDMGSGGEWCYTKKKSKQKKNTRRKKKRTLKRTKRIPPNGVIIRKKNKLYKSDGKKLSLLNY